MGEKRPTGVYLMFGGAAALAVGSFLPWAKLTAPLIGTVTKSGMEGSDGWVTLAAGVVLAGLAWAALSGKRHAPRWGLGVSLLVGAAVVWEYTDITHRISGITADTDLVIASHGAGLYICGLGSVAAFIGSLMAAEMADDQALGGMSRQIVANLSNGQPAFPPPSTAGLVERARAAVHAEEGRICPSGHENRPGALFCDICGSKVLEPF